VEKSEKRAQMTATPIHWHRLAFKFWLQVMKNCWEKYHRAFVKVVEDT
jgi:hypothetical protein